MSNIGWNIMEKVEPMLTGEELFDKMKVLPEYDECIRQESQATRLMALDQIHSFYLPSAMSTEIYTKMYLAMVRAMKKKESKLAIQQRNLNGKNLRTCARGEEPTWGGIIAGSDSFSITGKSGVGKTTAIQRSIQLFGGEQVMEMESPFCKILPFISVQCPYDCSIKSMLLAILQKVDSALGTRYYDNMIRSKANISTLLIATSQTLLSHCAILCIDEVQNLIQHRNGMQLCSMLTELLNESGICIVFVSTPEARSFFEGVDYLARRTVGIQYERCGYDDYFRDFCRQLWKYQYIRHKSDISEVIIHWLYEHSAGIMAHVKYLFYTAQELAILNGREILDLNALEKAYQRMEMLHSHIQPEINLRKTVSVKKKSSINRKKVVAPVLGEVNNAITAEDHVVQHVVNKSTDSMWSFAEVAKEAKKLNRDMLSLLVAKVSITEVRV